MVTRALLLCVSLAVSPAALAAEPPLLQVALHGGYRAGGGLEDGATGDGRDLEEAASLALALELRFREGDDRYYQLWYSRQGSSLDDGTGRRDVDVEYLHLGGTVPLGGQARVRPYFAAGLGAARFSAAGAGAGDRTRFSGSLAIGVAFPLGERAALRLEARGYLTAMDTDSAIFCRADDGSAFCRITASGSTLFQAEALAGIALSF
ncbi:MAG: outer membrane beta-barrel protein [Steroidobacteraceae bacterium]|nr:outer membrane beta-barrel protein [Steroidobacteraceae bacterium]